MHCKNCGLEITSQSKTCPRCEHPVFIPKQHLRQSQENGSIDQWKEADYMPVEYEEEEKESFLAQLFSDNNMIVCGVAFAVRILYYIITGIIRLFFPVNWMIKLSNWVTLGIVLLLLYLQTEDSERSVPVSIATGILIFDFIAHCIGVLFSIIQWVGSLL